MVLEETDMITPVNNVSVVDARHAVQPAAEVKPDRQAQTPPVLKSGEVCGDQVTLKSAGQPDVDRS